MVRQNQKKNRNYITMAATTSSGQKIDRYVVIHVATTCDEHGVYVTKDSAEVIEIGWMLLDSKNLQEVSERHHVTRHEKRPANHLPDPALHQQRPSQAGQHPNHPSMQ